MRKPFYENSKVTVYCGDSREVLREMKSEGITFDLLLTDPPYGLNQKENKPSGVNAKRAKGAYADDLFPDTPEYARTVISPIISHSLEMCELGILTCGGRIRHLLPSPNEEGCMYQPASCAFNSWGHQDYQPIFYYGKPHGNVGKYRILSHTVTERAFSTEHPCAKPLEFWKKLMLCGTDGIEGKRILDPFGGSGTTGRAALDLNMHATLIELNPRYCELIAKNCAQEVLF